MGTLTIFAWGVGGNYLFWLLNSQVSAHSVREDVVEQISGHHGNKQPRDGATQRPEHFSNDELPPKASPSAFHHLLIMSSGSVRALIC